MGFILWIILLLLVAFNGHGVASEKKASTWIIRNNRYVSQFWNLILYILLGIAVLQKGIGLSNFLTVIALILSSVTVFFTSFFLKKSSK